MVTVVRYSLLLSIYLFIYAPAYPNKIDSLSTKEDVRKFLVDNFSTQQLTNTFYTQVVAVFFKLDIDNNGLTDLLVKADKCIAVLDKGKGQYYFHDIYAGERESYDLIGVINADSSPLLVVRGWFYEAHIQDNKSWQDDTLILNFGDFIEYNAHPPTADVEEINFKLGNGYPGRVWDMKIDAGGWVTLEKNHGTRIFAGTIDSITLETLVQTINYIDLPALIERESRNSEIGITFN